MHGNPHFNEPEMPQNQPFPYIYFRHRKIRRVVWLRLAHHRTVALSFISPISSNRSWDLHVY